MEEYDTGVSLRKNRVKLFHDFGFDDAELLPGRSYRMPPVPIVKNTDFRADTGTDVRIRFFRRFPKSGSAKISFTHVDLTLRTGANGSSIRLVA